MTKLSKGDNFCNKQWDTIIRTMRWEDGLQTVDSPEIL